MIRQRDQGRSGAGSAAESRTAATDDSAAGATLRNLPSVNAVLERPRIADLIERYGHAVVRDAVQAAVTDLRAKLTSQSGELDRDALISKAESLAERRIRARNRSSLRRVVNATGVVVHTNLGRAPLAPAAARAAARAGQAYVSLEYDLKQGTRGSRYVHCERLLCELTGAEAALVVNNNAAALLLAVNTAAAGKDVLISRGEMVEIGGGFRVHEILGKSGATLLEIGATNKTHLADYARPLRERRGDVGAVLKVHHSNFVQSGFVADVDLRALVKLLHDEAADGDATPESSADGEAAEVPLIYDLGSGCMTDLSFAGIAGEPLVRDAVEAGATMITFSGDKLLGGPQAGILVGRRRWIAKARANPLTRALRVDKLTLAALEATLRLHLNARHARKLPVLALLGRPYAELLTMAQHLAAALREVDGVAAEVADTEGRTGGGSLPGAVFRGAGVAVRVLGLSAHQLEAALRSATIPVIGRIEDDRVILDLRSVPPAEVRYISHAIRRIAKRVNEGG